MTPDRPMVVLIHGLWMTGLEMAWLGWRLRRRGYQTRLFGYSGRRASLAENAQRLRAFIESSGATPHLVAHSLGGLVALRLLTDAPACPVGRVVALGAPLMGSKGAMVLAWWPFWRWLFGRCLEQGLDGRGPRQLPPGREMGGVAGTLGVGMTRLLLWWMMESPNDGVVTVAETRLPGMVLRLVPVSHMGLLFSRRVVELVEGFIQNGRFPED